MLLADTSAQRYEEDRTFVSSVRGEEACDIVIKKCQARSTEVEGVCRQVQPSA